MINTAVEPGQDAGFDLQWGGLKAKAVSLSADGQVGTAAAGYYLGYLVTTVEDNLIVSCAKGTGLPSGATRTFNNYFSVPAANISDCSGGGCAAETYTQLDPQLDGSYKPLNAALRTAGIYLGGGDFYGKAFQSPPSIGAVQYQGGARSIAARTATARSSTPRQIARRMALVN